MCFLLGRWILITVKVWRKRLAQKMVIEPNVGINGPRIAVKTEQFCLMRINGLGGDVQSLRYLLGIEILGKGTQYFPLPFGCLRENLFTALQELGIHLFDL